MNGPPMKGSLSATRARVDRLAQQIQRQRFEQGVDLEPLLALLDEGRRMNAAGIRPRELTDEEFVMWAAELRASLRGRDEAVLAERLIAGRQNVRRYRQVDEDTAPGKAARA